MDLNGLWKNPDGGLLVQLAGDVNYCITHPPYHMPYHSDMATFKGAMKVIKGYPTLSLGNLISVLPKRDVNVIIMDLNLNMVLDEESLWRIEAIVVPKRSQIQQTVVDALKDPGTENLEIP